MNRSWQIQSALFIYLAVSGTCALLDMLGFLALAPALGPFMASVSSTVIAAVLSFIANAKLAFRASITWRLAIRFFLVTGFVSFSGGLITTFVSSTGSSDIFSKLMSMGCVALMQLLIHLGWTFRKVD